MRIATVAVYVRDRKRAVEFWTAQVGFEVRAQRSMGPGGDRLEVAPPVAESCLTLYPRERMEDRAERKPSVVFERPDLAAAYEVLRARGVEFTQAPAVGSVRDLRRPRRRLVRAPRGGRDLVTGPSGKSGPD